MRAPVILIVLLASGVAWAQPEVGAPRPAPSRRGGFTIELGFGAAARQWDDAGLEDRGSGPGFTFGIGAFVTPALAVTFRAIGTQTGELAEPATFGLYGVGAQYLLGRRGFLGGTVGIASRETDPDEGRVAAASGRAGLVVWQDDLNALSLAAELLAARFERGPGGALMIAVGYQHY